MARHFDGASYLYVNNTGTWNETCSVFFWVKTGATALQTAYYAGTSNYDTDCEVSVTQAYGVYCGGAPVPGRFCWSSTNFPISGAAQWHQVAIAYISPAEVRIYVDGNYAGGPNDSAAEWAGNHATVFLGAHPIAQYAALVGDLADVCFWMSYVITPADVALMWAGSRPNTIQPANIIAYWPLPTTGELTNLAGGTTFGSLTAVGTVTSPDPPYGGIIGPDLSNTQNHILGAI